MKLSILICSLESRSESLYKLLESLHNQFIDIKPIKLATRINNTVLLRLVYKDVEILISQDNKQLSVGAKRNLLIEQSKGEYITFIDDDDQVAPDYIDSLLQGIESGYDSICFKVLYNPAGGTPKLVKYSANYKDRELVTHFERATNHLMCTKRSIASKVKFKNISFGEDAIWAKSLVRLIKNEGQIDKVLYYYNFDHAKSETQ